MGGIFTQKTAIMVFAELINEGGAVGVERFAPHRIGRSYDVTAALSSDDPDVKLSEALYWERRPESSEPYPVNADIGPDGWPQWEEDTSDETCSDADLHSPATCDGYGNDF